ncbi:MAG TPA: hypothetical protein VLW85_11490 [Myxococcales bacterium]|nr:hypothetical protein [Myxococcales bacterium]
MSDNVRHDNDPALQVSNDLRARLRGMAGDELIELCAQLLTTYVIEGVVPLARASESTDVAADNVGDETFAQMLKRLKASKKDPILERFIIDGENISVRIDGQGVLPLTEYRRPTAPPRGPGVSVVEAPPPRRESVPGASTSIYNRSLYSNEATPARVGAPPQPPAPQQPASPQQAQRPAAQQQPAQPAQPGQPGQKKEEPKNDRFSLIELE